MNRRSLLLGIGSALAAPSIVRAESLMKLWVPSRRFAALAHGSPSIYMTDAWSRINLAVPYHGQTLEVPPNSYVVWDGASYNLQTFR